MGIELSNHLVIFQAEFVLQLCRNSARHRWMRQHERSKYYFVRILVLDRYQIMFGSSVGNTMALFITPSYENSD